MKLWSNLLKKLEKFYVEANEGKLRRDKGILDEKVMAFDTQDFRP